MTMTEWVGRDLGTRVMTYDDRDVILYALAVGASASDLPLVYEKDLHVLPTFVMTLGLWVADAASAAGAFVPATALHGAQRLTVREPLPTAGSIEVRGSISAVWDTGRSAVLDVVAESDHFAATYSIFLPGQGGFGGSKPARPPQVDLDAEAHTTVTDRVDADRAALYRLTGDRHLIHIDPDAAGAAGFDRPILHGLCTLGIAARAAAKVTGASPWDLRELEATFSAPVFPGDVIEVDGVDGVAVDFRARVDETVVLKSGHAVFG